MNTHRKVAEDARVRPVEVQRIVYKRGLSALLRVAIVMGAGASLAGM